jgi:hypothetical protein
MNSPIFLLASGIGPNVYVNLLVASEKKRPDRSNMRSKQRVCASALAGESSAR